MKPEEMPEVNLRKRQHEDSRMRECEEQKKGHSQTRKDIYVLYELKEGSEIHWRVEVQRRADYTGSPSLKYFPYSAKNVHTLKKLACNCLTLEGG